MTWICDCGWWNEGKDCLNPECDSNYLKGDE